ncbi:MAG: anti-sigma factor [Acidobacteria bacterium]|nr:anti-sigma factor [Acidobacteriota bacterium]
MSNCKQMEEYYEAYALGALEGEERAALEAHLETGCPVCKQHVSEARWLVSQLAYLAPQTEPPSHLRARVLKAAGDARPRRVPVGWLAAAAATVLALFLGSQLVQVRREIAALQTELAEQRERQAELMQALGDHRTAFSVLSAGETKEVRLASSDAARAEVRAYWHEQLGLVLSAERVAAPAPDRTFQLWIVPRQGNPISAGIFRPNAAGAVLHVADPGTEIGKVAALAITDEPAGGRPQPTSTPIWLGKII